MSIFPSSPSVNDLFTSNGFTWKWDGVAWSSFYSPYQQALQEYIIMDKTSSYLLANGDQGKVIQMNSSSGVTVTVPTDGSYNFAIGTQFTIIQKGTGQVTVEAVTPATTIINSTPGNKTRAQWSSVELVKTEANKWVLMGDLTA